MGPLAGRLRPCGPLLDAAAAGRTLETLALAAAAEGWSEVLDQAREALAPVFSASPYLAGLAVRPPQRLHAILRDDPEQRLAAILGQTEALAAEPGDLEAVKRALRGLKADIHLLTALADLGGVWSLDEVTGALSGFAEAAIGAALAAAAGAEAARGRLRPAEPVARDPVPGFFVVGMGKLGALELNYSSDIDLCVFFDPDLVPAADGVEVQALASRLTQTLAEVLQQRTSDGYVFRTDLRLRPDPSSTPPAVSLPSALDYYESVGQNWERAAFIKARLVGGDRVCGQAFMQAMQPFIWRRNLDFAAIADVHAIKLQIHAFKVDDRLTARGADLKLGRGGIREIEFYAQTQQLVLGGRDPSLRANRTVDALAALAAAGQVAPAAAEELTQAYVALRGLEHRAQMIADEQTHRLPEDDAARRRVATLSGQSSLARFDAQVGRILKRVNRRYGELFAGDEDLSSRFGSLVFTGVEDDPETLRTLARMGFSHPAQVASTIRGWHHGHIAATRSERGRELFTRLTPRLLEAAEATGAPDDAFIRFGDFFAGLSAGVQVQSLFLAQPRLLELVVKVMAFAPNLARMLARQPAALDAMLDRGFFQPLAAGEHAAALAAALRRTPPGFEAAMDTVRRVRREQAFRLGVQVMSGSVSAEESCAAFTDLADACIGALAPAALAEAKRIGGAFEGEVVVLALGKCGSREMTAASDLDLMTLYRADPGAVSATKGWSPETAFARFTQRLITALSAPTAEGPLYQVDMRLRPSGSAGPVAVSAAAFEAYYADDAEIWELQALTRARVMWTNSEAWARSVRATIEATLRAPRQARAVAIEVREMRALIAKEHPASGFWDLKRSPGGLIDIEFAAQHLQLVHAPYGGPLRVHTGEALEAMEAAGLADAQALHALKAAWRLQQDLAQLLKVALDDAADPAAEPKGFQALLAQAAGAGSFDRLKTRLRQRRAAAHAAFERLLKEASETSDRAGQTG